MTTRIQRSNVIRSLAVLFGALCAGGAQAWPPQPTPWMVQLVVQAGPTGFQVVEQRATDCFPADWKDAEGEFQIDVLGPAGEPLHQISLRDLRMVFVEPPDGERYLGDPLIRVGSKLMHASSTIVLNLPLNEGGNPMLPARVVLSDDGGRVHFDVEVKMHQLVAGDELGCAVVSPPPPPAPGA